MSKCQICKISETNYAWQPFGPNESGKSFPFLGSHYRGFPVVEICETCKKDIENDIPTEFYFKSEHYIFGQNEVVHIPKWVGDPLAYWEQKT